MNTEDLLKPRYRVVADYPGNSRGIGFIYLMDAIDHEGLYTTTGYLQECFFTQYPHLFKKMNWWEDRKIEDMPEYVRHCVNHRVFRVKIWRAEYGQLVAYEFLKDGGMKASWYKPSTKEEYEQYLKTQQP